MTAKQRFGSKHTEYKLENLAAYLKAYTTALKRQSFRLVYFDAFAGTGDIQIGDETPLLEAVDDYSPFIEGSAVRALECGTAFERYVFVEKSRTKSKQLRDKLIAKFPTLQDRIDIHQGEANKELLDFCASTDWKKTRAVVFLDPQGNQIKWKTIEAIARTQAIDLWYLFPAGLGVHRQIGRDGKVHFSHGASLDGLFGTTDWQHSFIEEQDGADLFQKRTDRSKVATPKSITLFMIRRMREVFKGGVLDEWLQLGSRGIHMYSLLFAWANPSGKAKLAGNLAKAVLGSARRGRSK